MKAFVVAALLVASVASQSFDLMDKSLYNKFNKPTHRLSTVEELLLKEKLGNQMMGYNKYNTFNNFNDMDLTHMFGGQQVNILSLEELVNIPLFREYMQIPTFRQFWEEYPVAMKKYVESPLFQQFWTVPQFQQYFRNPIFFYKYIVPQVQMISQTMYPTTEGIYNTPKYTPFMYNKYQPVYNREIPSTTYGQNVYSGLNYNTKYLLEKIYSHLNKKDVTETFTDVKMLPTGQVQEQTVGKIVDPITGEEKITVGDVKIVDEKIVPVDTMNFPVVGLDTKYQMDKIFGHHNTETIKDVLLKHIILNKIFGEKKVFTPEVYQTLFDKEEVMTPEIFNTIFTTDKKVVVPEMLETIFGNKKVLSPEVYETLFDNKKVMTPEIFETVFGNKKNIITPQVYEMLVGLKQKDNLMMTPELFEPVFGKKIYTPEVYGTLFGEKTDLYNTNDYYKYKMEEPIVSMLNKNKMMMMSPLVNRMLKNKKINQLNKLNLNKMDLTTLKTIQKIQTEKMIEEIQKEKIMKELIKDTEIPKMMETEKYQHIPLTYGKPIFASTLNKFEDKEIKNFF